MKINDRYLFKAKKKNWQELPKDEQWVQGYLFDDGFENGRMFVGGLVVEKYTGTACDDWTVTGVDFYEIDPNTICQCTGLKDKNGKLIWENDVVKCVDENNDIEFTAIIEFGNPNGLYDWGYQLQHIKGDEPNLDILLWVDMEEAGATCKVIGNIFDNPELWEIEADEEIER